MKPYRGHHPDCWGFYELYAKECPDYSRNSGVCRDCREYFLAQMRTSGERTNPEYFIARAGSAIGLNKKKTRWAINRVKEIRRKKPVVLCRSPLTIAAGMIYIACLKFGNPRTQNEVAKTCRVTEGTVRVAYKDMMLVLKETSSSSTERQSK